MNNIQRLENNSPTIEPVELITKLEEMVKEPESLPKEEIKEIPKSNLKMKSIKGFTEKKKKLKILKMKNHVMEELKSSINIFDANELYLNHSLVLFVAQIVEDFFNKKEQGDIKRDVVLEVCKPFFDGKEDLVDMVLELVFDKIEKTTLFRRNKQRLKNVGSFFLELFLPSIQKNFTSKLKL
jgi:hypothetical protein